jgi:hypothetical protein
MSEINKPVNMGLMLFPPPPKAPRKMSVARHAIHTQPPHGSEVERSGSPAPLDGRESRQGGRQTPITVPPPAHHGADRAPTSFSEARTLVPGNSNSSHQSNTRAGPDDSLQGGEEPVMRSIFPRYNPDLPLEHQQYYPTQTSPTHIPREVISRRPYSPEGRSPLQSPHVLGVNVGNFPRGVSEAPIMDPSSTEELMDLWKVVNGWRVQQSEARTFCMKMTSASEEPVHILSSATQPFYTIRMDPTSASAQVTVKRHDPNKTPKRFSTTKGSSSSKSDQGIEVLHTTLEEYSRRLPPNDGLVALLYPKAASKLVIELANSPNQRADIEQVAATAEHECGRLVWDEDSKKYYLAHPAVGTPFMVSISSSPAWSKVEYVLEHEQLPRNMVRLVRDGAGSGLIEVDTGVAARIDCYYIMDVAICAVLLVAIMEEQKNHVERFEAPPVPPKNSPDPNSFKGGKTKGQTKWKKEKDVKVEEFDLDLESQDYSMKDKKEKSDKTEQVPGFFGLIWILVKCFVWSVATLIKGLASIIIAVSKLLTRTKS